LGKQGQRDGTAIKADSKVVENIQGRLKAANAIIHTLRAGRRAAPPSPNHLLERWFFLHGQCSVLTAASSAMTNKAKNPTAGFGSGV
jgi:hypothetical protein